MKRMIAIAFVFALLIGLCACQKPQDSNDPTQITTTPTQLQPKPTQTQPTDPIPTQTQPTEPVDPRIAEMQALLEKKGTNNLYNLALVSEYATPTDVDLYYIFCYGFKDESMNPTDDEVACLEDMYGPNLANGKIIRLPIGKMDARLTELFGITLSQTNRVGFDRFTYLEETECYYCGPASDHSVSIRVQSVEDQDDGTVRVYYRRGRGSDPFQDMIVTLKPVGDGYQILSNLYASPMIGEMQNLLDWNSDYAFYNTALTSVYENPADVDLANLFYNGFRDESDEPTEEELNLLEGKMGKYWKEMDLIRLPVEKMDAVLMDLFGITLDQTNGVGLDRLVYLEETDCYYTAVTGMHYADITVAYVETLLEDFSLIVQYSAPLYGNFMVKLMPIPDGGYQILSNEAIDHLYNETGVWNAIVEYFDQREAYLLGTSAEISNIMPGILPDVASHLAAINSAGVEWLGSDITMEITGCGDSHAEAIVTETVKFCVNGAEQTEIVVHRIHSFLSNDGAIIVASDGYQEITTGFISAAYVPPERW